MYRFDGRPGLVKYAIMEQNYSACDTLEPVSIHIYDNDVLVKYERLNYIPPEKIERRARIAEFTYKSRKRLAFVAANTPVTFLSMITLTYPGEFPTDGARVKSDFKRFKQWISRAFEKPSVLWFLEFQFRGAPHFHMLIDTMIDKDRYEDVSKKWYLIVGSGDSRHLRAGTRVEALRSKEGGKRYAVKYAMKMQQKRVPDGFMSVGRFWGHTRDVAPVERYSEPVHSKRELLSKLGDWGYKEKLHHRELSVLYGAAKSVSLNKLKRLREMGIRNGELEHDEL